MKLTMGLNFPVAEEDLLRAPSSAEETAVLVETGMPASADEEHGLAPR